MCFCSLFCCCGIRGLCVVVSVCLICAVRASCDACEGRGLRLWVRPDRFTEGRRGQEGSGSSCSCYSAVPQDRSIDVFIYLFDSEPGK